MRRNSSGSMPSCRGGVVHQLFAGGGLHHPRAAVGRGSAGVGPHLRGVPPEAVDLVRAGHQRADERAGAAAADRVGAGVVEVVDVDAEDLVVGVDVELRLHPFLAGVGRGDEVLAAVLRPLDGGVGEEGGEGDGLLLAAEERLETEAAADVADADPDVVLRQAGDAGEDAAHLVRVLAGDVDVEELVEGVVVGDDGAALHRHGAVAVLDERRLDRVRRGLALGLRLVGHGDAHHHADVGHAVLVDLVLHVGAGGEPVDDGRQRVEVDLDQFGGVLGEVAVAGDDQHDRVADEAHVVLGQREDRGHEVVGALEHRGQHRHRDLVVEVVGGEHRHDALGLAGGRHVEVRDLRPGEVAAQEVRVQHVGEDDVVRVVAPARQQAGVLLAGDGLTDEASGADSSVTHLAFPLVCARTEARAPPATGRTET